MRHCSSHFLRKMLCLPLLAVLPVIVVAQDSLNKPILSNGEPPIFVEATAETISLVDKDSVSELIQERYANGAVKIERQLAQDEVGNFINHGSWKCWDPSGKLISEGQYEHGMREGEWVRYHHVKDSPLFKTAPYDKFEAPFVSVATFNLGELDGEWQISDAQQRKISQWNFVDGVRHGASLWFHPNGRTMREIVYDNGRIDGNFVAFDETGQVVQEDKYIQGRRIETKTTMHKATKQRATQGDFLGQLVVIKTKDDWWNARPATYATQGDEVKHGQWKAWYPNGQLERENQFRLGRPVGKFIAWHPNGQVAVTGTYIEGSQTGHWVWRHPNGLKKTDGHYTDGAPSGRWYWWSIDGKVVQKADHAEGTSNISKRPSSAAPSSRRAAQPNRSSQQR